MSSVAFDARSLLFLRAVVKRYGDPIFTTRRVKSAAHARELQSAADEVLPVGYCVPGRLPLGAISLVLRFDVLYIGCEHSASDGSHLHAWQLDHRIVGLRILSNVCATVPAS
ncbi:hypothetical protein VSR68_08775 [Paraburkholderia phymatum]|uniref:hypothetical protein n=1 Tax=Paraburkholderia phymatum TaxID=148447 RepID=UPI0031779DB3